MEYQQLFGNTYFTVVIQISSDIYCICCMYVCIRLMCFDPLRYVLIRSDKSCVILSPTINRISNIYEYNTGVPWVYDHNISENCNGEFC